MTTALWRTYLVLGAAALCAYLLLGEGAGAVLYTVVGLSGAGAMLLGVRLHRPVRPVPWYCMAAGQLLWAGADTVYSYDDLVRGVEPSPGASDALYLTAYGAFAVAFLLLLRGRRTVRDKEGLLDSALFCVAAALVTWVLVVQDVVASSDASGGERVLGLAYPLGDLLLFGLVVRLVTTPGGRTPAFRLLVAAGGLLCVADVAYAEIVLLSSYEGGAIDLVWLGSYVLWGASALHPSMRSLSEPVPDSVATFTRGRLVALTLASLTAPAVLVVQLALHAELDAWAVALSSVLLSLLVVARMSGLLGRLQEQAGELDRLSRTDVLTDLPNRRSGDAELARALWRARAVGGPLVVAMLDLDRFKAFNDTFGHQAGDRLLSEAASAWTRALAGRAVLARYGGEEFLLVAPGLAEDAVAELLAELGRVTPAGQSFSGGLASWDGDERPESLVHRADVALYTAKREGRDRVVRAEPTAAERPGLTLAG